MLDTWKTSTDEQEALKALADVQKIVMEQALLVPMYHMSAVNVVNKSAGPFFTSGLAVGAGDARLIWRYVLPNILPVVIVYAAMNLGQSILSAAILSFLGLGVTPPTPEWGQMVESGGSSCGWPPGWCFTPVWPSSGRCSVSTCWETGCATPGIPSYVNRGDAVGWTFS